MVAGRLSAWPRPNACAYAAALQHDETRHRTQTDRTSHDERFESRADRSGGRRRADQRDAHRGRSAPGDTSWDVASLENLLSRGQIVLDSRSPRNPGQLSQLTRHRDLPSFLRTLVIEPDAAPSHPPSPPQTAATQPATQSNPRPPHAQQRSWRAEDPSTPPATARAHHRSCDTGHTAPPQHDAIHQPRQRVRAEHSARRRRSARRDRAADQQHE